MRFFVTTAKGMEECLVQELQSFGLGGVEPSRAGVSFEGEIEDAYGVCLWSRIANRVLLPLKSFPAPTPEKLYAGVKSIRWSDHLTPGETLAIDFASTRSFLEHTQFGAQKTKDAICDQLVSVQGARPDVDIREPDIRINVYVMENQATVSLDLSGDSLHRRGYREDDAGAPLKENLAAALLMTAGWPEIAAAGGVFLDPMCGSGTLPIEAALMAGDRAPGLTRKWFGFLKWRQHVSEPWEQLLKDAQERAKEGESSIPRVIGYDGDSRAVRIALANVEAAGLRGKVHIERREFEGLIPPEGTRVVEPIPGENGSQPPPRSATPVGLILLNPPYGERLGEVEELRDTYKRIGDTFKQRFRGWRGFVFTGSSELSKCVGLKASRRHVFYNGALECRLLRYELY